jgi:hypothetical protein
MTPSSQHTHSTSYKIFAWYLYNSVTSHYHIVMSQAHLPCAPRQYLGAYWTQAWTVRCGKLEWFGNLSLVG